MSPYEPRPEGLNTQPAPPSVVETLRTPDLNAVPFDASQWQPIERAPKDCRTLLLGCPNSHGNWRTVRGQWMSIEYIARYWEEPDGVDAGWFETCEEIEECWRITPTHWMPLPPAPGTAATPAAQSAGRKAVRYFVYDNEGGYEEYGTDAERAAAHKSAISGYLDDGWSEEVDSVVSGIVTHKTVKCNVEQRPKSCVEHPEHDGDNCDACDAWNEWPNHEFDYTCRYEPEALYAVLANAEDGGANLYYVQDTRSFVGNCPTWWGKDFRGYVTRIDEAGKYTHEEAERICKRDTDKMWPCSMIDPLRRPTIDFQHLPPDDERIAAIAAIAAKSTKRAATSTLRE
ncbi:hypothetical protein [Pandoraea captiosa]|nr:hypothetical protein [Pandoraea captiosa]